MTNGDKSLTSTFTAYSVMAIIHVHDTAHMFCSECVSIDGWKSTAILIQSISHVSNVHI